MTTKTLAAIVGITLTAVLILAGAGAGAFLAAASACGAGPSSGASATALPATTGPTAAPSAGPVQPAGCADSQLTLQRAATWLTAWSGGPVPYLSSANPATWLDGYRRDCSGYASMALGLPGPGLDTPAMAARFTPITKTDLRPGDLLINPGSGPAGHVVIFDQWADAAMASYLGYEQSADGGTHHRLIPYPYFGDYPISPYRPAN